MAFDLNSITKEKRMLAPRIILLGVEKIGKSTFASQADRPIFVQVKGEEGVDQIEVPKFPTAQSFGDVMECLETIHNEKHDFGTTVIDSGSTLEPVIWKQVCEKNNNAKSISDVQGGYGWGYIKALEEWRILTEALDKIRLRKNMASIIIGHVKVKRFDDPVASASYDQYQFDINEKAANLLYRWADAILFCNTKIVVKKTDVGFSREMGRGKEVYEGARYLYTQKRPGHPGGGRGVYGRLPYELPLSWAAYQNTIAAQVKKEATDASI